VSSPTPPVGLCFHCPRATSQSHVRPYPGRDSYPRVPRQSRPSITVQSSSSLRLLPSLRALRDRKVTSLRVIRQALEFYVDLFPPYLSLRPRVIRQALEFYVDLFPPYLSLCLRVIRQALEFYVDLFPPYLRLRLSLPLPRISVKDLYYLEFTAIRINVSASISATPSLSSVNIRNTPRGYNFFRLLRFHISFASVLHRI